MKGYRTCLWKSSDNQIAEFKILKGSFCPWAIINGAPCILICKIINLYEKYVALSFVCLRGNWKEGGGRERNWMEGGQFLLFSYKRNWKEIRRGKNK